MICQGEVVHPPLHHLVSLSALSSAHCRPLPHWPPRFPRFSPSGWLGSDPTRQPAPILDAPWDTVTRCWRRWSAERVVERQYLTVPTATGACPSFVAILYIYFSFVDRIWSFRPISAAQKAKQPNVFVLNKTKKVK